jgi:hypothetical protein
MPVVRTYHGQKSLVAYAQVNLFAIRFDLKAKASRRGVKIRSVGG